MRNKTAYIFVLLANLVLLAHAVIPHHHHTEAPVEIAVECSHENEHEHEHHEKMPFCNGEHDTGETAPCVLAEAILIPNNQVRLNELMELSADNHILFFTLYVFNYSIPTNCESSSNEVLESIPLYSQLLVSSQGLRAPPIC